MPLRRRYNLIRRQAYDLSPTKRRGLRLGRPRPGLLTLPPSINSSKGTVSWRSPGVSTKVIGLPRPSHRTCTLVENPPRLRPRASFSGSPPLPLLRAGEHVSRSYQRSGLPTLSDRWRQRSVVPRPVSYPIYPVWSSDRSEWLPSARGRNVRVSLARERQSCLSRAYH